MTTPNNTFSSSRFGFYMNKHLVENRKKLLQFSLQFLLSIVLLVDFMPWLLNVYNYPSDHDAFWSIEYGWLGFAFFVLMGATGAMMYSSVENKGGKIATFMNPASSFEKFLVYLLVYGLGSIAVFILFFYIADYIRVWTSGWYANPDAKVLPLPMDYILTSGHDYKFHAIIREGRSSVTVAPGVLQFLIFFSASMVFNAFNVLGSIVWNKRPFIKTFGTLFLLNSIGGFLLFEGMRLFFDNGSLIMIQPRPAFEMLSSVEMCWITGIVTLVFVSILYYISYVRFKETELINRW